MNIRAIIEGLFKVQRQVFTVAEHAIVYVRQAFGHLPGDGQHAEAVALLRKAFPSLAKWVAHIIVAVVFGWLEKAKPEVLAPPVNHFAPDDGTDGTTMSKSPVLPGGLMASPFAEAADGSQIVPVGEFSPPQGAELPRTASVLSQIIQPRAPTA